MKKKGMINEIHRQSSEDKWYKIIKAIDDGEKYDGTGFSSVDVVSDCGYCVEASERLGRGFMCRGDCYISVSVCGATGRGRQNYLRRFRHAIEGGYRNKARKYAVKIYDYIKNDKPEVK